MTPDLATLNRAFWDLGLRFSWDEATYASLARLPDLRSRLEHYLQKEHPHLLGVYDVDFLHGIIVERMASPSDHYIGLEAHRSF